MAGALLGFVFEVCRPVIHDQGIDKTTHLYRSDYYQALTFCYIFSQKRYLSYVFNNLNATNPQASMVGKKALSL